MHMNTSEKSVTSLSQNIIDAIPGGLAARLIYKRLRRTGDSIPAAIINTSLNMVTPRGIVSTALISLMPGTFRVIDARDMSGSKKFSEQEAIDAGRGIIGDLLTIGAATIFTIANPLHETGLREIATVVGAYSFLTYVRFEASSLTQHLRSPQRS